MTETFMKSKLRALPVVLAAVLMSGCAATTSTGQSAGTPPRDTDALKVYKEVRGLKEELKRLRSQVEEMQYQADTALRRERNLLDDLDRRLLAVERAQRLGKAEAESGDAAGDESAAAGDEGETPAGEVAAIDPDAAAAVDPESQVSLDEQQAYNQAFGLMKQSRFAEAIEQFQKFVDTWPGSQLADDAYFMLANTYEFNRENRAALAAYKNVVARYPNSDKTPNALLGIGDIQYKIGAYHEAAEIYREVLRRFPVHAVAVPAESKLRRIEQTIQ